MKLEGIDRILVAVKDLDAASKRFSNLLGLRFEEVRVDDEQKVKYTRTALGFELIQSTRPDAPVAKFIDKRGEGLYALMFKVSDLKTAIEEMKARGLQLVAQSKIGGLEEAYFHPKDSHGVMIVLCEYEARHGSTIAEMQE